MIVALKQEKLTWGAPKIVGPSMPFSIALA